MKLGEWISKKIHQKRDEKIECWKAEAKSRNARYLVITFSTWDKFERPFYAMRATSAVQACLDAAPYGSTEVSIDAFRIWEPEEKKDTIECPKCGEVVEV